MPVTTKYSRVVAVDASRSGPRFVSASPTPTTTTTGLEEAAAKFRPVPQRSNEPHAETLISGASKQGP